MAECQATVSSHEFSYWCELYKSEDFGWRKHRAAAAHVQATVANTVPRKRGSRPFRSTDFLPKE